MKILFRRSRFAYVLLVVMLCLTALAWFFADKAFVRYAHSRFDRHSQQVVDTLAFRVQTYVNALIQTRALFATNPDITRDDFYTYVESLNLERNYPGVQGIGFAPRVMRGSFSQHEKQVQESGYLGYQIWPKEPARDEMFPIVLLEPFTWRNQRAFGYDMFSDVIRRNAMERARDTGQAAASARVTLVQETSVGQQKGFLIYLPYYQDGMPTRTVAERREALLGFVYIPFRMDDMFRGVFGVDKGLLEGLHVEIYGSVEASRENLLYDTDVTESVLSNTGDSMFQISRSMEVAGRTWNVHLASTDSFDVRSATYAPLVILFGGIALSFLLFWVVRQEEVARAEAEKGLKLRNDFLSIASHELKTPLTALQAQVQLLTMNFRKRHMLDAEKLNRVLGMTEGQVKRLTRLVNDLLDVSRIGSGKLALEPRQMDLTEVVRDVVEKFSPDLEAAGCSLNLELSEPVTGSWDRFRVEQVVVNLLSNAIKYGRGRPIEIRVENVGEKARLAVRDHGIGITPENRARIFEPFERAAVSKNYGGLGLGLYISHQIVEAHSGTIHVESWAGEGTLFLVELPRNVEDQPTTGPKEVDFAQSAQAVAEK